MESGNPGLDRRRRLSATVVATLAHDLQNLLTLIGGGVDAVRAIAPAGPAADEALAELDRAIDGAFRIGLELLEIAQPERMDAAVVDVNEVVTQAPHLVARVLGGRVPIRVELTSGPLVVRADPVRLEWVLLNLASNANDAMPHGGVVTIATTVVDVPDTTTNGTVTTRPYVRLSVADAGPGMGRDLQETAFEPFFTTKPGRTGLGLTSAAITVGRLGGWLRLRNNVPHGTRAEVYLPLL
jgi:two-component system, cell cycle sensor histidine kinase and response regulator CckA